MKRRFSVIASLLFAALALVPVGAHLLALPNKIGMDATDYFVAQQAYRGWAFTGVFVFGAIAATLHLAWQARRNAALFRPALVALLCLVATQAVFWSLNYPGNAQTRNWSVVTANWEALRLRWELGHALSAVLTLGALLALLTVDLREAFWIRFRAAADAGGATGLSPR